MVVVPLTIARVGKFVHRMCVQSAPVMHNVALGRSVNKVYVRQGVEHHRIVLQGKPVKRLQKHVGVLKTVSVLQVRSVVPIRAMIVNKISNVVLESFVSTNVVKQVSAVQM